MPRLSVIHDPVLAELARELRQAPRGALLRQIERAEALAGQIDPETDYPRDWVVFRVTGYRPDGADATVTSGHSLLESLSAFVERLCEQAELTPEDLPEGSFEVDELCARWQVSRKSVDRARRRGLVARRVGGSGARRIVFSPAAVEAHEARAHPGPKPEGRRIPGDVRAQMIARAARYRRMLGCSANQSARRLARRYDYSAEAIRQLLKRHDEQAGEQAIFREQGPLSRREQELAFRVLRRGLSPATVARRLDRSTGSIRRACLQYRARMLETIDLEGPRAPVFERDDAEEVILTRPAVRERASGRIPASLHAFLDLCRSSKAPDRTSERDLAIALHLLRCRAREGIAEIKRVGPGVLKVDEVETTLRRASRLKTALVEGQLKLLIATGEQRLGAGLESLPERTLVSLLDCLFSSLCGAVDRFDPFHGGRLASPASIALDRAALEWARAHEIVRPREGRAQRRLIDPGVDVACRVVDAWQRWLEPDVRIESVLSQLDEADADFLRQRFGLAGAWPRSASDLAQSLGIPVQHVVRRERAAVRRALEIARSRIG
ncbi:MAG: hypothetical protein D6695_10105 [Planctomycetota bacterium]|nr:MAG: hypothetical protein D6695_10105 [Planctomycetota bacterium]